jgi:hypothetical protein
MTTKRQLPQVGPDQARPEVQAVRAVFKRFGIHDNTGYAWIRAGIFPVPLEKIGPHYYCRRADVDLYLAPKATPEPKAKPEPKSRRKP